MRLRGAQAVRQCKKSDDRRGVTNGSASDPSASAPDSWRLLPVLRLEKCFDRANQSIGLIPVG